MNRYKNLYIISIFLLICCASAAADQLIHRCFFNNVIYDFRASKEEIEKMPQWDIEEEKPTPISPKKASLIAKRALKDIKLDDGWVWRLKELALVPLHSKNKWAWKVVYIKSPNGQVYNGTLWDHPILVTFKGSVIKAKKKQ